MEVDPMNSILNVMSKLNPEEGLSIQYMVRSARPGWHSRAGEIGRKIYKGYSVDEVLKSYSRGPFSKFIFELFGGEKKKKDKNDYSAASNRLTQMEEEMLKGIEEKNAKAGLDVNIRVVVSASNKGQAKIYLENLSSVFSAYNFYEYGNSFWNKISTGNQRKIIRNFIYRNFDQKLSFLLNTEELASLYHFPNQTAQTPNILWLTAKQAPVPSNLPDEGIVLGTNYYRGVKKDVHMLRDDRRRHTYIIGKSGVGKSTLIASMAVQDIMNGEGVCVLDPHGDLIEEIGKRIPPERAEDVIIFAPADIERPLGPQFN